MSSPLALLGTVQARVLETPIAGELCAPTPSERVFNYMLSQESPHADAEPSPRRPAAMRSVRAAVQPPAARTEAAGRADEVVETSFAHMAQHAHERASGHTGDARSGSDAAQLPPPPPPPQAGCAARWSRGGDATTAFDSYQQQLLSQQTLRAGPPGSPQLLRGARGMPGASYALGLGASAPRTEPRAAGAMAAAFAPNSAPPRACGFSTGNGSRVIVTEAALARSAALLAECEREAQLELGASDRAPLRSIQSPPVLPIPAVPLQLRTPALAAHPPRPDLAQPAAQHTASGQMAPGQVAPPPAESPRTRQGLAPPPARAQLGSQAQPDLRTPQVPSAAKLARGRTFVPPMQAHKHARLEERPVTSRLSGEQALHTPPTCKSALPSLYDLEARASRPRRSLQQLRDAYGAAEVEGAALPPALPDASLGLAPCATFRFGSGEAARGTDELLAALRVEGARLDGAEGQAWVQRHFAQIVWKLGAYERAMPALRGVALTEARALAQLRYRYEREVVRNHRSVLQRIVEGDSHAARLMVLLVSGVAAAPAGGGSARLELTDGWNAVGVQLDARLSALVGARRLGVGDKLVVCGSRLAGSGQDGTPPTLAVCANGTRRARWDARLGLQPPRLQMHAALRTLLPGGGAAPSVRVLVQRHYPVQFLHKQPDSTRRVRSFRLEQVEAEGCAESFGSAGAQWADALRDAADKSPLNEQLPSLDLAAVCALAEDAHTGADLAALVLALVQRDRHVAARKLGQLDHAQRVTLRAACGGLAPPELTPPEREVTAFCRLAVSDLARGDCVELTVWWPPEHVTETGKLEGTCWQLSFVEACELRDARLRLVCAFAGAGAGTGAGARAPLELALMTGKMTTWTQLPPQQVLFLLRSALPLDALCSLRTGDEFCVVGALLHTGEPYESRGQRCFHAFVAAADASDVLCVCVRADGHWLARAPPLSVVALTDLRYVRHDAPLGIHLASADDDAPAPGAASPQYARAAAEALRARLAADEGARAHLERLQEHVRRVVNGEVWVFPSPPNLLVGPAAAPPVPQGEDMRVPCEVCDAIVPQAELEQHLTLCMALGMSQL
ncbi:hypothetical protein T492DRAFT_950521 [Pavlovales sp. CCMP2436]|nr:hypothetical protein T492DRAFT_950521 [Pavlovales sp. CCMP2436]